jgi:hypothetical protein
MRPHVTQDRGHEVVDTETGDWNALNARLRNGGDGLKDASIFPDHSRDVLFDCTLIQRIERRSLGHSSGVLISLAIAVTNFRARPVRKTRAPLRANVLATVLPIAPAAP